MNQLIMLIMMMNSFIFTQTSHPMSMGLVLLIQTMLTCIFTGLMTKSFWFSYILFLIFIGGMLILFIYMASLASNEKFNFTYKNLIIMSFVLVSMIFIFLIFDKFLLTHSFFNSEFNNMTNFSILLKENFLSVSKMYDLPNNFIIIFLINYLLLNLIIIVKITNIFYGPLRPKN